MARAWLAEALGVAPSRSAVRRLIMAGALRVGGRPCRRPGWMVEGGARLEAEVGPLLRPRAAPAAFGAGRVLYEDDDLIVVDKPAGVPTVPTADPARPHLVGLVAGLLAARAGAAERPYLGVHQRLDRDTSGVVLFTKRPEANAGLAAQFASRAVRKTYAALTARPAQPPPESWREARPLAAPQAGAGKGGRAAVTEFQVREVLPGGLLVEARPLTGRKHQVRIHLALSGLPLVGDRAYGGPEGTRVMLHAARLELRHPVSGARLEVGSPWPDDFRRALDALRRRPRDAARRR